MRLKNIEKTAEFFSAPGMFKFILIEINSLLLTLFRKALRSSLPANMLFRVSIN